MIRKCYNSIETIYKEVLTDVFWRVEYDQMRMKDPHVHTRILKGFSLPCHKIFTLENLLNRVATLKTFRKDARSFLELIHQRELTLKQMHLAVDSI